MDYLHSSIVDPSSYETEGLCDGIDVRMHHGQIMEDLGAISALNDWKAYNASSGFDGKGAGSLGPRFDFLSVAIPEMLPNRIRTLAYLNEFIFLHDDVVESVDKKRGDRLNDEAMEVCLGNITQSPAKSNRKSRTKQMMSKISHEVLSIDAGSGSVALALWAEWFEKGGGRHNHTRFDTLREYLDYRILDVGKMYLTGVVIFAMGLMISEPELELLSTLCCPAWTALGLTNDLYSLEKELKAATEAGELHINNAVWVLMYQHTLSVSEAKQLCRQKIRENVAKYVETVRLTLLRNDVSHDFRTFIEAIQYIISGNVVWTLGAPRYNPGVSYNALQLDWIAYGTPESLEKRETTLY